MITKPSSPHPAVSLEVGALVPGVALVLHGAVPVTGATPSAAALFDSTWAFILEPSPDGNTRLISRERYRYRPPGHAAQQPPRPNAKGTGRGG